MKVAVVYIFPIAYQQTYGPAARRFAESYMKFPPGERDHDIYVYSNGDKISEAQKRYFSPLPCVFKEHNNQGKDIGAFQRAAEEIPCDLMVFLGSNVHFRKAGWLDRIIQVYEQNGPALYGCWAFHQPATHIRTTAFWMPPELLNSYPDYVDNSQRYDFEHGNKSIVRHVRSMGYQSYMVTWSGAFAENEWHHVTNEDSLMLDNHTDRIGYK